ncbi:nucleoside/nucleotide kinase family protein [Roseobacter weihaiensis]|uniref:AAA family ATPase n=1 Tax=Roseobacter weihaiensis TaxID=2763262 RepID=UPI001D0A060E|nr:AAA family ATPase [Roseobacter sp. H9]
MQTDRDRAALLSRLSAVPITHRRRLIALAGPPASGKSTLAHDLAQDIPDSCVVPMDGFHIDNAVLQDRQLLDRKGAPETFDIAGFSHLLSRLRQEEEVLYPVFDRARDCAIAGAGLVKAQTTTVIVEGNYLLLDHDDWRVVTTTWDFSVYLSVPFPVLRDRLMQRWHLHGLSPEQARQKVDGNDLPNAVTTAEHLVAPDLILRDDPAE